jgi:hypothetical protein
MTKLASSPFACGNGYIAMTYRRIIGVYSLILTTTKILALKVFELSSYAKMFI